MKKILIMLFVVVVLLCSCGKQENPTETDAPGESESVPASKPTEPTPVPTSPTSESTEPTEPAPTEPVPTEPSKDDLSYYPYPLLDMTYGEIEEMFGELTEKNRYGEGYYPYIPQHKVSLTYGVVPGEKIPEDKKPVSLIFDEPLEQKIYPGLNIGMSANEIPTDINFDFWDTTGYEDDFEGCIFSAEVDSYTVLIFFEIPDEILKQHGKFDITKSEEEYEQYKQWVKEYSKEILNTDEKVEQINIFLKR